MVLPLLCGGLLAFFVPAIREAREAPNRMGCSCNLKGIGLALHNYYAMEGCLPPAYLADEDGTPMHSWRTLILPYLDCKGVHAQYDFNQPWDSPHNRRVTAAPLPLNHGAEMFSCPSVRGRPGEANYVMIVGPVTARRSG